MNALEQALLWLDAEPARFWTLAGGMAVLTGVACAVPPGRSTAARRWGALFFALAVVATLAAFRWPVWFYPLELNPDESQTVAGAITLAHSPVYWKSVDGTTHGPWSEYLLVAAHCLGAPLGYPAARIIATLLEAGAVLAAWGTLRCFTSERLARIAVLPGLAFWSFTTWDDFVHYSSELPAVFLLTLAGWLLALVLTAAEWQRRHAIILALAGACLGSLPLAKLQSLPCGLLLGLAALSLLWRRGRNMAPNPATRMTAALMLGALTPAAATALALTVYGLWGHFIPSYIYSALAYVNLGQHPLVEMPIRFFHFSATDPAFAWFFWGCLGFSLLYARTVHSDRHLRVSLILSWGLLAAACFCVLRPGREVVHYLQLLVMPLTVLTGLTLAAALREEPATQPKPSAPLRAVLLFSLLTLLPQVYHRSVTWHRFAGHLPEHLARPASEAARFILEHRRAGDAVAMWGWECHLLVETGLPHGTREAHTANQLTEWPLRHYFTERYLSDMERRQPAWFVDSVGPGAFIYHDRGAWAHETVPALRLLIANDYELVGEFANKRVFRRKSVIHP